MDELNVEVVEPGSADDPFAPGTSAPASTAASAAPAATGEADGGDGAAQSDEELDSLEIDTLDSNPDGGEDDTEGQELTQEELDALAELQQHFLAEAQAKIVPQLQSSYDRRIAAQDKQIQELRNLSKTREQELQAQLREAQLNGLPDAEKEKIKAVWAFEDREAALNARESELTGYHVEILRAAYAQEYAKFGLTAEDLEDYETPEQMDEFIREVQLEYYKQLSESRTAAPAAEAAPAARAKPATQARKAPAGASAPADSASGSAVPEVAKPNTGRGISAMADNLKSGAWETATIG